MRNLLEQTRHEITLLHAAILTLNQLPHARGKGMYLEQLLGKHPEIIKYFRAAYDERRWGFNSADVILHIAFNKPAPDVQPSLIYVLNGAARGGRWSTDGAADMARAVLLKLPPSLWETCYAVIDKDLACGLGIKTLNKVLTIIKRRLI